MLTRRALETSEIFDRIQSANVLDISSCGLSVAQSRATASLFHAINSICCCTRIPWLVQHKLYSLLHNFMTVQSGKHINHIEKSTNSIWIEIHSKEIRPNVFFALVKMNDQIQYKQNIHVYIYVQVQVGTYIAIYSAYTDFDSKRPSTNQAIQKSITIENKNLFSILRKAYSSDRKPKLTTYSLHLVKFMFTAPTIGRQLILNWLTEM